MECQSNMADGGGGEALRKVIPQWGPSCSISQLDWIASANLLFFVPSSAQVNSLNSPTGSQFLEFNKKYTGEAEVNPLRTPTLQRLWLTAGVPPDWLPPQLEGRDRIAPLQLFTPFIL